jgi:hypothetical protein
MHANSRKSTSTLMRNKSLLALVANRSFADDVGVVIPDRYY